MSANSHIRHQIGTVRPYICGPMNLPEFLLQVFNAVELERYEFDSESVHVEMQIGDSVVVVEAGKLPSDTAPWVGTIYIYVQDVDVVHARAIELGAKPLAPVEDKPYQERQGGFIDAGGNTWWVATYNAG
jgi:PhnB protein